MSAGLKPVLVGYSTISSSPFIGVFGFDDRPPVKAKTDLAILQDGRSISQYY